MNPKITLTNPTDDELNAAVATHVAKWKWLPLMSDPLGMWVGPDGLHYQARALPFTTSADAVLPLLYKTYWQVQQTTKAESQLRVRIGAEQDLSFGESDTFPRAACIALLLANGVEVVT